MAHDEQGDRQTSAKPKRLWGVLAEYASPKDLYHGCEAVRDAGFQKWDAHTPFPVHGLEKAMGLYASKLGWIVFGAGITGAGLAMLLQWWTSAVDYPVVISGKPLFSWPAFVPVMFEVMVLFAAFGAFLGMLHLNRLPRYHHPLFANPRFERVTDDKFFISIESTDPRFDEEKTEELLKGSGALQVERIDD